ncbi:hypothetical protein SBRCBS47491_000741 [Sporothrix bragantina]|uniref:Uncharacterized protein n=1 Tax=Sporothrix bragantina TaxID=671064 RepID=A0ABP0ASU0_9PEZI
MPEPSPPPPPPPQALTQTQVPAQASAGPLPSPMPSPSKTTANMSPSILPKLAPATAKRKRDIDDKGTDNDDSNPLKPPSQAPPLRTTIALHSGPRFSLIAPRPPTNNLGIEIDGTPPYPPAFGPLATAFGVRALSPDGGGSSPRTRVADRFQSLAIEGGDFAGVGGADTLVSEPAKSGLSEDRESGPLHKRMKRDDEDDNDNDQKSNEQQVIITKDGRIITDPVRASLTWQDDEITVYDPNDADDDGTGVNGIGFKPTPAIAHERALKRRQQLVAYRKREEREARARRSLQRTRAHQAAAAATATAAATAAARLTTFDSVALTAVTAADSPRTPRSHAAATAAATTAAAASLSSPPPTAPSSSPARRVRFLETGPVTIRFKEPDTVPSPTSILSS